MRRAEWKIYIMVRNSPPQTARYRTESRHDYVDVNNSATQPDAGKEFERTPVMRALVRS